MEDGICVPVLIIFLAFATGAAGEEGHISLVAHEFATEIGIGAGAGMVCILAGAVLIRIVRSGGQVGKIWMQVTTPAIAMTCFATAQSLAGSGFIACFVAGPIGGAAIPEHKHALLLAAEGTGETLALLTGVTFGAVVAGGVLDSSSWQALAYAVLSLTVIRMPPSFVALKGMGLTVSDKLFLGWFGPRRTIILSVIALGLTANPLAALYARRRKNGDDGAPAN